MRIDLNNRLREAESGTMESPSTRVPAGNAGNPAVAGDTAELSGDQVRAQALAAQVNQLPEVRQEKVDALGLAIRQGSYDVSAEQTAEAMLGEMQSRFAA